ncbi:hypothetical protein [Algiphilus sp.]|uniref:hypothetical protein n=1 Tax=Algiphilus sp. TaxID=1872431 RepID=UPI003CCC20E3
MAHELISKLKPDWQEYEDCISSIKFDLGEIDGITHMALVSKKEFFELPAPVCLFQIKHDNDLHLVLAKYDQEGNKRWKRFGKLAPYGAWQQSAIEVVISDEGTLRVYDLVQDRERPDIIETAGWVYEEPRIEGMTEEIYTFNLCVEIACALEVFSCSNVEQIEHEPPKKINETRIRKGKTPFFSWRTLHITGEESAGESKTVGGHASPRLHFRRGHIRRLSNGKRTWVRSCLVGDKKAGFSGHDYSVDGSKQS